VERHCLKDPQRGQPIAFTQSNFGPSFPFGFWWPFWHDL
jgi:hypothetical protein